MLGKLKRRISEWLCSKGIHRHEYTVKETFGHARRFEWECKQCGETGEFVTCDGMRWS